jgi:hypothetical protein
MSDKPVMDGIRAIGITAISFLTIFGLKDMLNPKRTDSATDYTECHRV